MTPVVPGDAVETLDAVEAVSLAEALLRQRDDAQRAIGAAVRRGRANELSLHIAEIDAAYFGVWDALDRAARGLERLGRCPPDYGALRASLQDVERKLGVFDATNTVGVKVSVGAGGIGVRQAGELGVVLNKEGARVAAQAAAVLKDAMPEIDWAARARAAAAPSLRVGRGVRPGPILFVLAIAAAAAGAFVVIRATRTERAPGAGDALARPQVDLDVTRLLSQDDAQIRRWLRDFGGRYPEARDDIRAGLTARLRARLADLDTPAAAHEAVADARGFELDEQVVNEARARHVALLEPAIATLDAGAIEWLLSDDDLLALPAPVRARVFARYDATMVEALAAGDDPVEVGRRVTAMTPKGPLPDAMAALAERGRAALAQAPSLERALALREFIDPAQFAAAAPALARRQIDEAPHLLALAVARDLAAAADVGDAHDGPLRVRARALLTRDVLRATTADELLELVDLAGAFLDEDVIARAVGPRAARLAASARDVEVLGDWFASELLDDAVTARTLARARALTRGSIAAARAFLDHDTLGALDVADDVAARLPAVCAAQLQRVTRGVDRALVALATTACTSDDGTLAYRPVGDDDQVAQAAEAITARLGALLAAAGDARELELEVEYDAADLGVVVEADPAVEARAERAAVDGARHDYPCRVSLTVLADGASVTFDATCTVAID